MAHLTAFHYRPGDTLAHHLDVRIKFIVLILISLTVLKAPMAFLGLITIGQMMLIVRLRLPLKVTLAELRFLLFLLAAVFVARALSTPGTPFVALKWLTISKEGLSEAALIVWRMLLIVLLGLPFVVTTRPADIKAAVEWFLKPVPFLPAARIGTMIGLLLRFVPTIFAQAGETMAAQRARAVENRKNPIYRLTKFVIPFVRRTFESADRLALAMEARGYTENRTEPQFSVRIQDWIALVVAMVFCCLVFWVEFAKQ
jgi:energy-coupling factor transporter transmembrane protein EcfT